MTIATVTFTDDGDSAGLPWDDISPADGEPPTLALTDRAGADRHLAAIARLEAEHELEKAGALAEVERIHGWIRQRYEAMWEQTKWHRDVLHRYHEAVLAVDPRLKTIKLPHGELQARAQQPSWEIDGSTALAWLAENLPSTVRPGKPPEPSIDVAALKRTVVVADGTVATPDGEVVPGVKVVPRDPKFSTVIAQDEPEPSEREKPAKRIVGVNWHAAACVDDEGKIECVCGLDDLRDLAVGMSPDGPDDGEACAQFQADQYDPGPDDYCPPHPF